MNNALDDAVTGKGLETAFQQVVLLSSGTVIGYEALARWPAKSVTPLDIITHATKTGRLNFLDRACIRSAAQGALRGNSSPGMLLLVNSEPATACADLAEDADVMRAAESFRLAFEITERGLLSDPRALLRKLAVLRSLGIAIALDDVGANPDSVALLDVVAPDILKLDIGLVQRPDRAHAQALAAIVAYRERTGAVICAEGIETEEHLQRALAYGATLGQGFMFGAPGELSAKPAVFRWHETRPRPQSETGPSVFDIVAAGRTSRTVTGSTVEGLLDDVQELAVTAEVPPIVLATLGREEIGETARRRYRCLAEKSPLVAVFGHDVSADLGDRVRRISLDATDPLSLELSIVVLSPDTAVSLVARERDPSQEFSADSDDRLFDVVFTFDRDRAAEAVRSLLDRPAPTISIHVDPKRRKLASCTCGWKAKSRRLRFMALGDVAEHRTKTGHMPVDARLAG